MRLLPIICLSIFFILGCLAGDKVIGFLMATSTAQKQVVALQAKPTQPQKDRLTILCEQKRYAEAEKLLLFDLSKGDDGHEPFWMKYLSLAVVCRYQHKSDKAELYLKQALKFMKMLPAGATDPEQTVQVDPVFYEMAEIAKERGNFEKSADYFEKVIEMEDANLSNGSAFKENLILYLNSYADLRKAMKQTKQETELRARANALQKSAVNDLGRFNKKQIRAMFPLEAPFIEAARKKFHYPEIDTAPAPYKTLEELLSEPRTSTRTSTAHEEVSAPSIKAVPATKEIKDLKFRAMLLSYDQNHEMQGYLQECSPSHSLSIEEKIPPLVKVPYSLANMEVPGISAGQAYTIGPDLPAQISISDNGFSIVKWAEGNLMTKSSNGSFRRTSVEDTMEGKHLAGLCLDPESKQILGLYSWCHSSVLYSRNLSDKHWTAKSKDLIFQGVLTPTCLALSKDGTLYTLETNVDECPIALLKMDKHGKLLSKRTFSSALNIGGGAALQIVPAGKYLAVISQQNLGDSVSKSAWIIDQNSGKILSFVPDYQ